MKKLLIILLLTSSFYSCTKEKKEIPYWLKDNAALYQTSPNKAAKAWFQNAKHGMFVHLNLASLLERGKDDYELWAKGKAPDRLLNNLNITRETYENTVDKNNLLYQKYTLENFNPEKICLLAKEAKMKYIVFTTHHLGGCYNFKTTLSNFNSLNAPCKKDLVAEMKKACEKYGIALFMYVPPQISKTNKESYEHNKTYLKELLTQYGDVAGIWFDGIGGFYKTPKDYEHLSELHAMVKKIQPHALISFKEGALGDEDFISPEHFMLPFSYKWDNSGIQKRYRIRADRWNEYNKTRWEGGMKNKLREINTVMQKCIGREDIGAGGGWINDSSTTHYTGEEVYDWLTYSRHTGSNMLMNIGPLKDGSIHPEDKKSLKKLGDLIEEKGWPIFENSPIK